MPLAECVAIEARTVEIVHTMEMPRREFVVSNAKIIQGMNMLRRELIMAEQIVSKLIVGELAISCSA